MEEPDKNYLSWSELEVKKRLDKRVVCESSSVTNLEPIVFFFFDHNLLEEITKYLIKY